VTPDVTSLAIVRYLQKARQKGSEVEKARKRLIRVFEEGEKIRLPDAERVQRLLKHDMISADYYWLDGEMVVVAGGKIVGFEQRSKPD